MMKRNRLKLCEKKIIIFLMCVLLVSLFFLSASAENIQTPREKTTVEGWSEDIPISNLTDNRSAYSPDIAVNTSIHVIYEPGYYTRSLDEGRTWSERKYIPTYGTSVITPKIAANEGLLHVVYEKVPGSEIYYTRSADNGDIWGSDILLSVDDGYMSYKPSMAVYSDSIHVVWADAKYDYPYNQEICYKRSTDGGDSWDDGQGNINQVRRLTFTNTTWSDIPKVAVNGSTVHVFWADDNYTANVYETYYIKSENNGANWSDPVRLTSTEDVYNSWALDVATDGEKIYVVGEQQGRRTTPYLYGIWFAKSEDNGKNWSNPITIVDHSTTGYFCSPSSIIVENGTIFVVLSDNRASGSSQGPTDIYIKYSENNDSSWSTEQKIVDFAGGGILCSSNGYLHLVFGTTVNSTPEVFYKRSPCFSPEITYAYPDTENIIINETENITFNIAAWDPDNQTLNYSWYVNSQLATANTTNYTFYTDYDTAGFYNITVIVSDQDHNTSYSWNLTVKNLNRKPNISDYHPKTNITIAEFQNQTFWVNATDEDNNNLTYKWYMNGSLLSGESNNSYVFISNYTSSGVYEIKMIVTDDGSPKLTNNHTWTLTIMNKNRPPVLETVGNQTAYEGELFILSINATDLDNDSLIFSDNSTLFDINSTTGLILFTPSYDSTGDYFINITVTDGEDMDWKTFKLTVNNVNRDPTAIISSPKDNAEFTTKDVIVFDATGSYDPDNDDLTYSWASSIDGNIGSTASFSKKLSKGTHTITLTVNDGNGGTDTAQITVTVSKPSEPNGGFIPGFDTNLLVIVCLLVVIIIRRFAEKC